VRHIASDGKHFEDGDTVNELVKEDESEISENEKIWSFLRDKIMRKLHFTLRSDSIHQHTCLTALVIGRRRTGSR
jgi:hypothetical protein